MPNHGLKDQENKLQYSCPIWNDLKHKLKIK